ncbi:MAG: hypothetical protein K5985_07345 [Lachnospiraceae bacterium]|nr:hypothetical protein [Lachnospiraceae bacterium]
MVVREISTDGLEGLREIMDPDVAENIGREGFKGLGVFDRYTAEFLAGMVWEFFEDGEEARIEWLKSLSPAAGELLFEEYAGAAAGDGILRTGVEIPLGDQAVEELLLRENFELELGESEDLYITLGELGVLKKKVPEGAGGVRSIDTLSSKQFERALKEALKQGRKIISPDLDRMPMYYFDKDVSSVFVDGDGEIRGLFLLHLTASGKLKSELIYAKKPDTGRCLLNMIDFSIRAAEKLYPENTVVILRRNKADARALTSRLLPDATGRDAVRGVQGAIP